MSLRRNQRACASVLSGEKRAVDYVSRSVCTKTTVAGQRDASAGAEAFAGSVVSLPGLRFSQPGLHCVLLGEAHGWLILQAGMPALI